MRLFALAICGAAALQPVRRTRRQSLAVRQAPRGVRERRLAARWREGGDTREPTPSPRRKTRSTTQGGDACGASGTSFYTTTEKQDSYDSLDKVLDAKCKDAGVRKVIVEMLDACGEITEARGRRWSRWRARRSRSSAQLSVDVIADEIMWEVAKGSEVVAYGASEEDEIVKCNPKGGPRSAGTPRRVVDRRQQLGRRHDHRRVRTRVLLSLLSELRVDGVKPWRPTSARSPRPASWSTEEPRPAKPHRGDGVSVTASPRPRSHGRPLSQWRSARDRKYKKSAQVGLKIRQGRRRLVGRHRSGPGHVVGRFAARAPL